jgi:hypothetical protein
MKYPYITWDKRHDTTCAHKSQTVVCVHHKRQTAIQHVREGEGSSTGPGAFQVAWSHHGLLVLQPATSAGVQMARLLRPAWRCLRLASPVLWRGGPAAADAAKQDGGDSPQDGRRHRGMSRVARRERDGRTGGRGQQDGGDRQAASPCRGEEEESWRHVTRAVRWLAGLIG